MDQAGFYAISVSLTDNGSDSKDGPLVETSKHTTYYYFYLQVTAESGFRGVVFDNSEEEAYQKRLRECGPKCVPVPEVESISRLGLVRFEFDRPMKVPNGYLDWKGNNTYLNET